MEEAKVRGDWVPRALRYRIGSKTYDRFVKSLYPHSKRRTEAYEVYVWARARFQENREAKKRTLAWYKHQYECFPGMVEILTKGADLQIASLKKELLKYQETLAKQQATINELTKPKD